MTLQDPEIQQRIGREFFAFLTKPDREAEYKIIKQIRSAEFAFVLSEQQADDMRELAHFSAEMYASLGDVMRASADNMLAEIAAKKLLNCFTLKN